MKMVRNKSITFEQGCELYLNNCRERNLREGTIRHYRQSYVQFYKYFDKNMDVKNITEKDYKAYILHLRSYIDNDRSINSYLRDFITTFHFLMNEGYVEPFKMRAIKVDDSPVDTYTEEELRALLKKPNMKTCSYAEYRNWVMTNLFFSTGIRQRSALFLKVKDIDFDNQLLHVNVTKNRKALIVPLSNTMTNILKEYLTHRQHKSLDDYLFCTSYGEQMTKGNSYHNLYEYNKARGVERTGIHRYRHTFAKQWILNGGNVVSLSKILGHSSLEITQNYLNLLVSDVSKDVDRLNLIDKFSVKEKIKINNKKH
jgi:integrase/recombinase XerD